jgi:hypothetical protein
LPDEAPQVIAKGDAQRALAQVLADLSACHYRLTALAVSLARVVDGDGPSAPDLVAELRAVEAHNVRAIERFAREMAAPTSETVRVSP